MKINLAGMNNKKYDSVNLNSEKTKGDRINNALFKCAYCNVLLNKALF